MLRPFSRLLLVLAVATACTSKGDGGPSGPNPTISLSLGSSAATVAQGGSSPVSATLTRGGGYSGTIDLTVEGAPAGVGAAVSGVATSGTITTATVTISVAASVTPGTYPLTIRGAGSGVTATTAAFSLTVLPPAAYTLALSSPTLTVNQGASDVVQVTIGRTNYSGAVTLALDGAPSGVTGVFAPPSPTLNSSTLTVSVAAGVAPGQYNLTVRGTGAASLRLDEPIPENLTDQTTPLTLTVAPAPAFALSLTQAAISMAPGGSAPTTVNIARTNFPGPVTFGLLGFPAGVTGAFNPTSTTGNTAVLTISATGQAAPGVYNLSVTGTGAPGNQSTPLSLTITAPGGLVTVDFSTCQQAGDKAVWLAVQSDNGPWQRVIPTGDVFQFPFVGTRGGIAWVNRVFAANVATVNSQFGTAAELPGVIMPCGPALPTQAFSATLQNIGLNNFGRVIYAGRNNTRTTDGLLQMTVPQGSYDLVAIRAPNNNPAAPTIRAIIRRAQSNAAFGTLDLTGPESFAGGTAAFTNSPLIGNEEQQHFMSYFTGPTCVAGGPLFSTGSFPVTSFNSVGIVSNQAAGDFHVLQVLTNGGSSATSFFGRSVQQSFHTLAGMNLVLPPLPPTPTTTVSGPRRIRAVFSRLPEYDGSVSLTYSDDAPVGHTTNVTMSGAYLAGQGATTFIEPPLLLGVSGFDSNWAAVGVSFAPYQITFNGGTLTGPCSEGARTVFGYRTGVAPSP